MDHAITIKDVMTFVEVIGGAVALFALVIFAVYVMNPFRSGH